MLVRSLCFRSLQRLGLRWTTWRGMSEEKDEDPATPQYITSLPTGVDAATIYGDHFASQTYKPREIERYGAMAVEVLGPGLVEQAFAQLRRRFREEGFDQIVRQRHTIQPSLMRRKQRRDAEYRRYKKEVAERMMWIQRFRGRGF